GVQTCALPIYPIFLNRFQILVRSNWPDSDSIRVSIVPICFLALVPRMALTLRRMHTSTVGAIPHERAFGGFIVDQCVSSQGRPNSTRQSHRSSPPQLRDNAIPPRKALFSSCYLRCLLVAVDY